MTLARQMLRVGLQVRVRNSVRVVTVVQCSVCTRYCTVHTTKGPGELKIVAACGLIMLHSAYRRPFSLSPQNTSHPLCAYAQSSPRLLLFAPPALLVFLPFRDTTAIRSAGPPLLSCPRLLCALPRRALRWHPSCIPPYMPLPTPPPPSPPSMILPCALATERHGFL